MKKTSICCALLLALGLGAQAKIWRVNNMPGVAADANTAQAAHDLASNGDTIHLEPSPTDYGSVTCTKRLVWLGTGYFLTENPGLQASYINGVISSMSFNAGSENSVVSVISNSYAYVYTNNITIARSWFYGISVSGTYNDVVITQNVIYYGIDLNNATDAIVTNNLVGQAVSNGSSGTAVVSNNVMGIYNNYGGTLYNSVFQNNILRGNAYTFSNTVASYNTTSSGSGLPAGNNNVFSADLTAVFENDGYFYQHRVDRDYRLKAGSPAIGTGNGGADRGAFGGSTPFVLGLQPAIPAITALSAPAANYTSSIQVTFSAKSNQ